MSFVKNTALLICLSCGLLVTITAPAQPTGFIYLQTENNTSFGVEWNGNVFSSSPTGYLVIPQMPSGDQVLLINFPSSLGNPYSFAVKLSDKPRGFSLRQFINNHWSLVDMVDLSLVPGKELLPEPKPKPVFEEPAESKVTEPPVLKTPELAITKKISPVIRKPIIDRVGEVHKIFDKAGTTGIDQVYILVTGKRSDTIALFIPVLQEPVRQTAAILDVNNRKIRQPVPETVSVSRSLFRHPVINTSN